MTDNEKRAHDFALALLNKVADARAQMDADSKSPDESGNIVVNVDYYKIYKEIYDSVLSSFERDFPSK